MSLLIKDLPEELKPRERLKKEGVENLTNEELLAILLRCGTKNISVKEIAINILKEIDTINNLDYLSLNKLSTIKGVGEVKAMSIISALELGKRVYLKQELNKTFQITNGEIVYNMYKYLYRLEKQENLIALLLDNKNYLIKSSTVFIGTINTSIAHPREIFNLAIKNSASSIIILHNHPSGDPTPSKVDLEFTKKIIATGEIIGIPVIDHIIIGNNKYYTYNSNKVVIM